MVEENKSRGRAGLFPHRLYIPPRQPGQCRERPPEEIDEWLRAHFAVWIEQCAGEGAQGVTYRAALAACCEELAISRDAARASMARVLEGQPRGGRGKHLITGETKVD